MDATIVRYPLIVLLSKAKRGIFFRKCSMDNNLPRIKANELLPHVAPFSETQNGSFRQMAADKFRPAKLVNLEAFRF
jgi:hypothetical protein